MNSLFAVGKMASLTAQAAREAGLADVSEFANVTEASPAVQRIVRNDDLVLLKASRVIGLERLSEALRQSPVSPSGRIVQPAAALAGALPSTTVTATLP